VNPQPATFQAIGLTKWYGQVIAVNDLSFTADAGIVGLLGPNGAGKSTLIKLLVGQLRPSSGRVLLGGQVPWANPSLTARLGYCPEHDRFYEDLSALDFVVVLTRLHGFGSARAEALSRAALERVDLTGQADKPVRALSHGMRQRLKLAQALAHRPQVLVLDEPLSGLDPIQRLRLISLLRAEAEAGTQVLVSSHVLHELEAMTDHILLINRGRMLAEGAVERIRALIDDHPHRIALTVDRARELGQVLLGHEDVVRVEVDGDRVVIETAAPDACYDRIGELACEGEFQIKAMVSLDDNLEAVFRYLVQ
jgi:ABC-2 type transport system ATP-binding protein